MRLEQSKNITNDDSLVYVPEKSFLRVDYDNAISHSGGIMSHIEFGSGNSSLASRNRIIEMISGFNTNINYIFSSVTSGNMHQAKIVSDKMLFQLPELVESDDVFGWRKSENILEGSEIDGEDSLSEVIDSLKVTTLENIGTLLLERQVSAEELNELKSISEIDRILGIFKMQFGKINETRIINISEEQAVVQEGNTAKKLPI